MSAKPLITVFGATGAQGGALVRAMLADPDRLFRIRTITRTPDGDKARALAAQGVEIVAADADKPETLGAAMAGAHGAFLVTNFWEHFSAEREQVQARSMADAAKAAGVKHVIWSTLEDTRKWIPLSDDRMPTLHGKYKVAHYDGKGEVDQYFRDIGVPTTFLATSFYWENLIYFGAGPQRAPDGGLVLPYCLGDAKLPGIAVEDIGKVAYAIFKAGDRYIGQTVAIAGEHLTGNEMAAALTDALGQDVKYWAVEPDVYRTFDFPGADDMGNMFQFKRDFNEYYCGVRDLDKTRALNPELKTFRAWLKDNASRIPVPA
jgi:uncharacterized protein YbjT (DUF2867 family)